MQTPDHFRLTIYSDPKEIDYFYIDFLLPHVIFRGLKDNNEDGFIDEEYKQFDFIANSGFGFWTDECYKSFEISFLGFGIKIRKQKGY